MSHTFISYSHNDEDLPFILKAHLIDRGIKTYIDAPSLQPGHEWRLKLKQALDDAYAVVVLCTKNAMESHEVTYEWSYAMALDIPVIPVIFEKDLELHSRLATLHHVDFSDAHQRNWDRLYQVLDDAKKTYQPTKGFLRKAGITQIAFSRNELGSEYSISRILDRAIKDSELIVIARSCEAWAREYEKLESAINNKNITIRLAMVNPTLPKAQWMIPSDWAQLDMNATIGKLKMITIRPECTGSLELSWLPSSPLFSFVYFSEEEHKHYGILEAGASLSLEERTAFIFCSDNIEGIILQRIHKIYQRVLNEGEKALTISCQK